MSEELSNKDIELLQYYYKKKKNKKIIVTVLLIAIVLCFTLYIGYSLYSQMHWEVKENNIKVEYGEKYEPALAALVDTNKYSFITLDNTTVTSNIKNESSKEYPAVGKYEIKISHNGKIGLFAIEHSYNSEQTITVEVKDTTPPTIKAPEVIEILIGESLDMDKYLYLFEVSDLSKTSELDLDASDVNNNMIGDYVIKATVEDTYGNKQTCDVPCSVISDPYGDEGTMQVETTTEESTTEPETTTAPTTQPTTSAKTTTTKKASTKSSSSTKTTAKKTTSYTSKDFLFEDGYTMSNVSEAATDYLRKSGKSGECVPLKDKDGIYIGMRVIIYD